MTSGRRILKVAAPIGLLGLFGLLIYVAVVGPIDSAIRVAREGASMQKSHAIYVAMFQYSLDNNGAFPTGKSSTEVFQKLLDKGYVSDPSLFYLPLPGKYPAKKETRLIPANVAWDLTSNLDFNGRGEDIPLVFVTGYRIEYRPGGRAVPLNSLPMAARMSGIPIVFASGASMFTKSADPKEGIVPNVIPADADLGGKTYRQLTPDGELPP